MRLKYSSDWYGIISRLYVIDHVGTGVSPCGSASIHRQEESRVASHDSALKAHRQNVKRRDHNRQMRTRLRGALRDIRAAIDSDDPAKVKDALRETVSLVDKMAKKKLIHKNTAGRYKSRLASRVAKKSAAA